MLTEKFKFKAKLWEWHGKGAWHFVTLPVGVAEDIKNIFAHAKRGWGSLPVTVTVGKSVWKTSNFPDKKIKSFLLPIKKAIREQESVSSGEELTVEIVVRD
jgi:hypothetical protein